MNNMQQQNEYMQTLKSIPDLLEEYFFANGIENEEQAKHSPEREVIAGFYPMLKAFSSEMEAFYGIKAEPVDVDDRAAASYLLATELLGKISEDEQFVQTPSCGEDLGHAFSEQLEKLFEWSKTLASEDDRRRYLSWNVFLADIAGHCLKTISDNRKNAVFEKIENSAVAYEIAVRFRENCNLDNNIEEINGILYDSCIRYAEGGMAPDRQEMVNQIIGRIREFGVTVAPERLQKVIYNCSLPLCEIVEEDRQQLAEILENSGNIEFLQQKYRNEVLAPEELRLQIFRQKIKENWEMPLSLADRELLPSQGSAVPRPVVDTGEFQMQEIRRNSQMQAQEKFWIKYETERRIAPGTGLENGVRNLLGNALAAEFYHAEGEESQVSFELDQMFRVLSVTDNKPVNRQVARNLLDFSREIMVFSEQSERYFGIKIVDKKLDRNVLAELSYADSLLPDDFNILSAFLSSFASHHKDIGKIISSCDFSHPNESLWEQVKKLPDSLEKFETVELYYHANLAILRQSVELEHGFWNNAVDEINKVHQDAFKKFADNLGLIGMLYPEVCRYGTEKLAREIEKGVCNGYLIPAYSGEANMSQADAHLFDEVEDIAEFDRFPEEAVSSIFKATDDFSDQAIEKHGLAINGEHASRILGLLKSYQSTYQYTEQLTSNVNRSSDVLKEQSALYCRYKLFRSDKNVQEVDKTFNYELLAHHTPGRN